MSETTRLERPVVPPVPLAAPPRWLAHLALFLFAVAFGMPAFWFRALWSGSWFFGWEIIGYGFTGFLDEPVVWLIGAVPFLLACAAFLGSYACFLLRRPRPSFWLAVGSTIIFGAIAAVLLFWQIGDMVNETPDPSSIVGPGLALWVVSPALLLWLTCRQPRGG